MDTDVIIKANSHGIRIIFHNDDPLEQLLVDIKEKASKCIFKKRRKNFCFF